MPCLYGADIRTVIINYFVVIDFVVIDIIPCI
jgi:hypothetical protein